jgi:predicted house-cleaning noncanonical NTP pyrophosphatase (MazG superfamily)
MTEEIKGSEIANMIYNFAAKNPKYREALLSDPKAVLGKQMGQEVPDWLTVKVVEETADTIYLVAPRAKTESGDELSDADLEKVAGGGKKGGDNDRDNTYTCNNTQGVATRVEITTDVGFM